ncbi:MAG: PAS domain S-box protein [Bacteroidales bacterium]|nr:PAS domain S-box protein [Bacteroidales bacterium]MCF8351182.1 PAS domain S-box protein [Bacteroidales bacterium]MCF8377702.1 PAS domain S-box protein [Bacteroidales bacterium]
MKDNKTSYEYILKENRKLKNEISRLSEECKLFKENDRKYNELFGKMPLAYQSLDEDGFLIEVNPCWLRILGYVNEEVIGKNFSEFLHPDSKPTFRKNYPRFKQQGSIYDVSLKLRRKDGSYLDVLIDGMISYAQDGRFKQTHCMFRDITKLSQITKKLKESEENYRNIYNNTPVMLHSINREGKLISVSDYWLEIMGYKREEVIGKPSIDFLTEESRKAYPFGHRHLAHL